MSARGPASAVAARRSRRSAARGAARARAPAARAGTGGARAALAGRPRRGARPARRGAAARRPAARDRPAARGRAARRDRRLPRAPLPARPRGRAAGGRARAPAGRARAGRRDVRRRPRRRTSSSPRRSSAATAPSRPRSCAGRTAVLVAAAAGRRRRARDRRGRARACAGRSSSRPRCERRPGAIGALAKAIEDLPPAQRDAHRGACWRGAVPAPPPLLAADGAAQLAAAGWEIGFHTRRHDLLTALDDDALRDALEPGATGRRRRATLAYPHGKATAREARRRARGRATSPPTPAAPRCSTERTDDHLIGRLQPDSATLGRFALQLARALSAA